MSTAHRGTAPATRHTHRAPRARGVTRGGRGAPMRRAHPCTWLSQDAELGI